MNPFITIITAVFNDVSHIEKTICSILDQTYNDIEYIIIDGGSTDGTLDIIHKYADKISLIVSEPDKGVYDAMNKGITLSHGDWVNFMNSGDIFHNNSTVEDLLFGQIENRDSIIYGDCSVTYWDGTYIEKPHAFFKTSMKFKGIGICHQTMFFPGDRIRKMQYDLKYRIAADYALAFQMYKEHVNFIYKDIIIADYAWGGGISSNPYGLVEVYKENAMVCGQQYNLLYIAKLWLEYWRLFRKKRNK